MGRASHRQSRSAPSALRYGSERSASGRERIVESVFDRLLGGSQTIQRALLGEGGGVALGELLKDVEQLAKVLHSTGPRQSEAIAIWLPMTRELVAAMLAVRRAGCVYCVFGVRAT